MICPVEPEGRANNFSERLHHPQLEALECLSSIAKATIGLHPPYSSINLQHDHHITLDNLFWSVPLN
jgi:hypothetical protein